MSAKPKPIKPFVHDGDNPPRQIVYEVHIEPPVEHARHYIGRSPDGGVAGLVRRLAKHGTSEGARLLQVAKERGSTWHLVRTWEGDGRKERQLKTRSGALYCPECTEHPMEGTSLPRPGAKYLTKKQREERRQQKEEKRMSLWELERQGSDLEDNPLEEPAAAGSRTAGQLVIAQADAGMDPRRIAEKQEDIAAGLLSEAETDEGRQFARGYDWTAGTLTRELREAAEGREPRPLPRVLSEAERNPQAVPLASGLEDGTPHPQLAHLGWEARGGVYQRTGQAHVRDLELEAG